MALIANSVTVEIILLVFQTYFGFDSGFIRKLVAIGMGALGIGLAISTQVYVSDLTSTPTNVFLFLTPSLQNAFVLMFTMITLAVLALEFIILRQIIRAKTWDERLELLV